MIFKESVSRLFVVALLKHIETSNKKVKNNHKIKVSLKIIHACMCDSPL